MLSSMTVRPFHMPIKGWVGGAAGSGGGATGAVVV